MLMTYLEVLAVVFVSVVSILVLFIFTGSSRR